MTEKNGSTNVTGQIYGVTQVVSHQALEQAALDMEQYVLETMKRSLEEELPPEPRAVIRSPKLEFEDYTVSWQERRGFFGRLLERIGVLKPIYHEEPMRRYVLTTVVAAR